MLSYLSKPIAPGVIPQQENIGLIAQVAAEKQNKYDNILGSIFAQYNNLLNLDTSANNAITEKYNGLMSEATKNLSSLAKLNLENPDSISKVESVFDPILNDVSIMDAVSKTQELKKTNATYEYWQTKKPELYNSKNHQYSLIMANENKNMSEEDFVNKSNSITPVAYQDIPKYLRDVYKDVPKKVTKISTPGGKGDYYIVTQENEIISKQDLLNAAPLDAKYIAQAEINAFFDYKGKVSGKQVIADNFRINDSAVKTYTKIEKDLSVSLEQINSRKSELSKLNPEGKIGSLELVGKYKALYPELESLTVNTNVKDLISFLDKKKENTTAALDKTQNKKNELLLSNKEYANKYNIKQNQDGTIEVGVEISDKLENDLLTGLWMRTISEQIAEPYILNNTTITIDEDPLQAKYLDYNLELQLEGAKAKLREVSSEGGSESKSVDSQSKKETNPLIAMSPTEATQVQKYDYSTFTSNKISALEDLKNIPKQYASQESSDFGAPSPELEKEYSQKSSEIAFLFNPNDPNSIYNKGVGSIDDLFINEDGTQKTITVGGTTKYTKDEFLKRYGNVLDFKFQEENIKQYLKVADKIEADLDKEAKLIMSQDNNLTDFKNRVLEKNKMDAGFRYYNLNEQLRIQLYEEGVTDSFLNNLIRYNKSTKPWGSKSFDSIEKERRAIKEYIIKANNIKTLQGIKKEKFDLLSKSLKPNMFSFKQGTDIDKNIKQFIQGSLATTEVLTPDVKNYTVYKDTDGRYKVTAQYEYSNGEKKMSAQSDKPIVLTDEFIQQNPKIFYTIETNKVLDLMEADGEASKNPKYFRYGITNSPSERVTSSFIIPGGIVIDVMYDANTQKFLYKTKGEKVSQSTSVNKDVLSALIVYGFNPNNINLASEQIDNIVYNYSIQK